MIDPEMLSLLYRPKIFFHGSQHILGNRLSQVVPLHVSVESQPWWLHNFRKITRINIEARVIHWRIGVAFP